MAINFNVFPYPNDFCHIFKMQWELKQGIYHPILQPPFKVMHSLRNLSTLGVPFIWVLKFCTYAIYLFCTKCILSHKPLVLWREPLNKQPFETNTTLSFCVFLLVHHSNAWCYKKLATIKTLSSSMTFRHHCICPFPIQIISFFCLHCFARPREYTWHIDFGQFYCWKKTFNLASWRVSSFYLVRPYNPCYIWIIDSWSPWIQFNIIIF